MKATLRTQLRISRRAMSEPDHGIVPSRPHSGAACSVTPVSLQWLDLIVIPLVGVDGEGRRLGMGGGYHDRALAFRRRRRY